MAETIRLEQPIWSGRRPVRGLWFERERHPANERRRLVFQAWRPGGRALAFADGDLVIWPAAEWHDVAELRGLPLLEVNAGLLSSAAIAPGGSRLGADVVLVRAHDAQGLCLGDGDPIDLSAMIDLSEYVEWLALPLSRAQSRPQPQLQGKPTRELLQGIPPPSAQQTQFLARLRGEPAGDSRGGPGLSAGLQGMLAGLISVFFPAPGRVAANSARTGAVRRTAGNPSIAHRAWSMLVERFQLQRLFGGVQARFVQHMLHLFERGDLLEALRHAIPINSDGKGLSSAGLFMPKRRAELSLVNPGVARQVTLPDFLNARLNELYRRAFAELDRRGEIDQAVYVLAELLNQRAEALDYLERKGRLRQAADLAIAWEMAPAQIVRLLVICGDIDRALAIARRDNAFADAIALLEKCAPAQADELRFEFARYLADRGDFPAAVDLVWKLPEHRRHAIEWLQLAEAHTPISEASALVMRACLMPETLPEREPLLREICFAAGATERRAALAAAILKDKAAAGPCARIAAWLLPALAADREAGTNSLSKSNFNRLLEISGDALLRADLPAMKYPGPAVTTSLLAGTLSIRMAAETRAARALWDVAILPGGNYLLAMGDAGVRMIDRFGASIQHFPVPAKRLACSEQGQLAIAMMPRESTWRMTQLDLVRRRARDFGTLAIQFVAPVIHGVNLRLVSDQRLMVVDASRSVRDLLWHLGDLPGPVVRADFGSSMDSFLIHSRLGLEQWKFLIPGWRLMSRDRLDVDAQDTLQMVGHHQWVNAKLVRQDDHFVVAFRRFGRSASIKLPNTTECGEERVRVCGFDHGLIVIVRGEIAQHVLIYHLIRDALIAQIDWPSDGDVRFSVRENHLLFFDEFGRLLHLPLHGHEARQLLISE